MMTIGLFLLLCLAAIVLLGISFHRPEARRKGEKRLVTYLLIWLCIGGAGIWTINRYTYPADKVNVFGNSDYHVLEHLGYQFRDSLPLADREHPENSLWDGTQGDAVLTVGGSLEISYQVEMDSFFMPFFRREEAHHADVLQNDCYAGLDASEGFQIHLGDSLLVAIDIEPYDAGDTLRYRVRFEQEKTARLSDFNLPIQYGYPLADLLRYTPGWQGHDSLVGLFEGAWLLRTIQGDGESALTFFPSRALQVLPGLRITAGGKAVTAKESDLRHSFDLQPEQRFFTGLGIRKSPKMYLKPKGKGHRLAFDFPDKYRLAREDDNQLFLCSDLQDVAQNVIQGGFLYPVFQEESNRFHVNATLRYRHGSSRERLVMQVNDHYASSTRPSQRIESGSEFALQVRDRNSNLQWALRLSDLRASNPLGRAHLFGFVIGFILLVTLTLRWIGEEQLGVIEMSLYVVVFAFLLLRLLLQWRMGVFPPVDDAGPGTMRILRSIRHFHVTVGLTLVFFLVRWALIRDTSHLGAGALKILKTFRSLGTPLTNMLGKIGQNSRITWWRESLETGRFTRYVVAYMIPWLALLITAIVVKKLDWQAPSRFVNIAFPMAWFFWVEYIIERFRSGEESRFWRTNPFSLVNSLATLVLLGLTDAGFGIIFLLFNLLFQAYRILMRPRDKSRSRGLSYWWAPAAIAGVVFIVVLFGADDFIHFVFARKTAFYWGVLLPGILGLVLYFVAYGLRNESSNRKKYILAGVAGGILLLSLVGSGFVKDKIDGFSYVKYRAAIHSGSADKIVENEQFATGRIGQIMRAAQNQWLINTYLRPLEPEEGRESAYFNLRPHFNKGSSYTTQTTDLVVTRYLISEHGVFVVIALLLLLLAVTGLYSFRVDLQESKRFIPFAMLLLVFTTALFIWLTATNRFIFFGQDFPLISLTSLFTLVFTLGMILVVVSSVPQSSHARASRRRGGGQPIWVTGAPLIALLAIGLFIQQSRRTLDEENFDFNLSLDQARADFSELNDEFRSFQNTISPGLPADSVLALFHHSRRDSVVSGQVFTQTVYDHFVNKEKDRMNPDHLLYMVQRPEAGRLKYLFALNPSYYLIRPPQKNRQDWTGDLLAARETENGVYLVGQEGERMLISGDSAVGNLETQLPEHQNQLKMAVVPSSWLANGLPAVLVWTGVSGEKAPEYSLTDVMDANREIEPGYQDPAVRIRSGEVLSLHGEKNRRMRFRYEEDFKEFLAKNIWLNGEQRLFYPLGDQLLWAYYYSGSVRHSRSNTEDRHLDQRVSIDFSLTRNIHQIAEKAFRQNNWDRQRLGVVVLDGNGRIRTLSDYHNENQLDPNDIDEIHEKNREFHLRRNNHDERSTFGNVNLLKLTNGAGSSIKPLMYAAVTSQYNLGWEKLSTVGIPVSQRDKIRDPDTGTLHFYGGRRVEIGWGGIEDNDFDPKSAREYLVQSKNLYHSLVMYLGSYRKEELRNNLFAYRESDRPTVFMPAWVTADSVDFPVVNLGRGNWTLRKEGWPLSTAKGKTFFGDAGSLLGEGLFTNLGLPTYRLRSAARADYVDIDPLQSDIYAGADPGSRLYAYPEMSHFYQADRALRPENPLWFIQGMRQATAGNDPVVLTPLKIAEMAGMLFSQNRRFRASVDDTEEAGKERVGWRVDTSSWGSSGYHDFVKYNIFASMRDVMIGGTAREFGRRLRKGSPYFYYGKTGTIGDADDEETSPDKLMLLVISKGDVTQMSPEELAENKFYVIYFTGLEMYKKYGMAPVWDMYTEIVREVENSYLFQSYMQ